MSLYTVLGISQTATTEDIREAYKKKALLHHPDRNPDDKLSSERKFKEIGHAYETLMDTVKRADYDRGLRKATSSSSSSRTSSTGPRPNWPGDPYAFGWSSQAKPGKAQQQQQSPRGYASAEYRNEQRRRQSDFFYGADSASTRSSPFSTPPRKPAGTAEQPSSPKPAQPSPKPSQPSASTSQSSPKPAQPSASTSARTESPRTLFERTNLRPADGNGANGSTAYFFSARKSPPDPRTMPSQPPKAEEERAAAERASQYFFSGKDLHNERLFERPAASASPPPPPKPQQQQPSATSNAAFKKSFAAYESDDDSDNHEDDAKVPTAAPVASAPPRAAPKADHDVDGVTAGLRSASLNGAASPSKSNGDTHSTGAWSFPKEFVFGSPNNSSASATPAATATPPLAPPKFAFATPGQSPSFAPATPAPSFATTAPSFAPSFATSPAPSFAPTASSFATSPARSFAFQPAATSSAPSFATSSAPPSPAPPFATSPSPTSFKPSATPSVPSPAHPRATAPSAQPPAQSPAFVPAAAPTAASPSRSPQPFSTTSAPSASNGASPTSFPFKFVPPTMAPTTPSSEPTDTPATARFVDNAIECTLEEVYAGVTKTVSRQRHRLGINGRYTEQWTGPVTIPRGSTDGQLVMVDNAGDEYHPGKLAVGLFSVKILPHRTFVRRGDDLCCTVNIHVADALTGVQSSLPALDGRLIAVSTTPGLVVQPNSTLRIFGEGMPKQGLEAGSRGDLIIQFTVVFPERLVLSAEQKAQLRTLLTHK